MNALHLIALAAGAGVLYAAVGKAAPRIVSLEPGQRYRVRALVRPPLDALKRELVRASLQAGASASNVTFADVGDETLVGFDHVPFAARELRVGEPFLAIGELELELADIVKI